MGELRRTVEEVVQFYAFKDVVSRWRENIMVTRLKTITWDTAVVDEIDAIFAELSRFIEGHSHSDEMQGAIPKVEDLEDLIRRVDTIIPKLRVDRQKPH